MQTFLPEPSFEISAICLDYRRLGKQRVECKQILNALLHNGGWKNHPAVTMWRGHEYLLAKYAIEICDEWLRRGYKDTLKPFFEDVCLDHTKLKEPWWLGNKTFHDSHKSNLVRKLPDYYRRFWPEMPSDMPYLWPEEENKFRIITDGQNKIVQSTEIHGHGFG